MKVPCHGVRSFDVMAGKVKRAPEAWQRCGMEWLYRVLQEPGRMWRRYLTTNSLFMWMLGREAAKSASRARPLSNPETSVKTRWGTPKAAINKVMSCFACLPVPDASPVD
jgi:N-acetylglucosaminyldiphosphoundecaprenol N-acetyl-beta-D-mannosaminyltransferase